VIERHEITSHDQWMALRAQDVTASVVGALFGVHPYTTIGRLHVEKVDGAIFGNPESSVMRRGTALEKIVAEEVQRRYKNWSIVKAKEYFRDPEVRLGATPDYLISQHEPDKGVGILQCKTVGAMQWRKEWTEETLPFWVSLQALTEMMLTDCQWGVVAALVIGDFTFDLYCYDMERHPAAEERIRLASKEFWQAIDEGREPKIDYERDAELLKALYPRELVGKTVDLRGDNRIGELLERREILKASAKETDKQLDAIDAEIKHKIGDAETATARGWLLSYKLHHRKEHWVAASDYRRLNVKRET
jgi:predicted phage-related endonuclease